MSQFGVCYAHFGGVVKILEDARWVLQYCGQMTGTMTKTCGGPAIMETFNNRCYIIF